MDKLIIALIVVVVLTLIFGCIALWQYLRSGTPSAITPIAPATPSCTLTCANDAISSAARDYYATKGPFAGKYIITPTKSNQVSATECDIAYIYTPANTTAMLSYKPGTDKRRFTFKQDANCTWVVTAMGENNSGITV